MTSGQKLAMAEALEGLGVDIIEAGFAAASPGDFDAIKTIAETIKDSTICSLARCNEGDISAPAAKRLSQRAQAASIPLSRPRLCTVNIN